MSLSIPILMYHQVSPEPDTEFLRFTVTQESFANQMKLLKLLGFTPITLNELPYSKEDNGKPKTKPIIITFDDGLRDLLDYAVPVLKSYGFPAVFYISTDYVGKQSSWMVPEIGIEFPVMNWDEIKDLDSDGFQIGSHSMSHPYLARLSAEDCLSELKGSREILENRLGHEVRHMAYPNGSVNDNVRSLAEESGYHTACSSIKRIASTKDDPLLLPRLVIAGEDTVLDFITKIYTARAPWASINGRTRALYRKFIRFFGS